MKSGINIGGIVDVAKASIQVEMTALFVASQYFWKNKRCNPFGPSAFGGLKYFMAEKVSAIDKGVVSK